MSFLLKIVFTGIIAFVPRTDGNGERVGVDVLLIDGRQGRVASDYVPVLPHYPMLRYRVADLADDCPTRPKCEQPSVWFRYAVRTDVPQVLTEIREVVVLDGLDITLAPEGRSPAYQEVQCPKLRRAGDRLDPNMLVEPCGLRSKSFPDLELKNFNDFNLVLRLSDIAGASGGDVGSIDPDCLAESEPTDGCKGVVAARLHLDGGLILAQPSQDENGALRQWVSETLRDRGRRDPHNDRIFAGSVEVYFSFDNVDSVLFQARRFGQEGSLEPFLRLFPNSDTKIGQKRVIEVVIENVPVADLFADPPGQDPRLEPLRHAEAHYDLAANKRPFHLRPVPTRIRSADGLSEASTIRCEPETQFAPHPVSDGSLFYATDQKGGRK